MMMRTWGTTLLVLTLALSTFGLSEPAHSRSRPRVVPNRLVRPQRPPLRIGGFDFRRSQHGSFTEGDFFDQARVSIAAYFPGTTFTSTGTLTPEFLGGIDLLVLPVVSGEFSTASALNSHEQTALRDFVAEGGCLMGLLDHSRPSFPITQSITSAFGLHACGSSSDQAASVITPARNSITNGRFGLIEGFTQSRPGALIPTKLGECLAIHLMGCALVVIDFGEISDGSGAAIFFSDVSTFVDDDEIRGANFSANEALFLNVIEACAARINVDIDGGERSDVRGTDVSVAGTPPVTTAIRPDQAGRGVIENFRVIGMNEPAFAQASFVSVLFQPSPSAGFIQADLVSALFQAAPTRSLIQADAVSAWFQAMPSRSLVHAAPVSVFFRAFPSPAFTQAAPVAALFQSLPTQSFACAVPVSALFPVLPRQGFVQAAPVSARFQLLPTQLSTRLSLWLTKDENKRR